MFQRILVCLDRTKQAEKILPYACAQVRSSGGKLLLLHICKREFYTYDITPSGQLVYAPVNLIEKDFRNRWNKGALYLRRIAKRLNVLAIGAESAVVEAVGTIPESILAFAEENGVDLIAMASNGRTGIRRLLSGSVSSDVAKKSHIPVLLVTPKDGKGFPATAPLSEPNLRDWPESAPPDSWSEDLDPSSALTSA